MNATANGGSLDIVVNETNRQRGRGSATNLADLVASANGGKPDKLWLAQQGPSEFPSYAHGRKSDG